jgi:hypothetical protein
MKKHSKKIAVITMMMVFLTSFSFIGVFAEENVPEAGSVTTVEAKATPEAISNFATYSSKDSVWLEWSPSKDAEKYEVSVNNVVKFTGVPSKKTADGNFLYQVTGLKAVGDKAATINYAFKVVAINGSNRSAESVLNDSPVRPIGYKLKIKKSGTLKSHAGKKAKYKVKKGQWLYADRFGAGGKYIFNRNGSTFYCDRLRTSTRKAIYSTKNPYSEKEAEFFVNDSGLESKKTGVLVWVNTYTQHIYMFTGKKGAWKCVLNKPCSTGKASSPTPTGINGKKKVWKKIKTRHGIKWWSPFQEINSIHAKKKSWKIGKPSSNGCVRNYIENAKAVYDKAKIGSTVYVF